MRRHLFALPGAGASVRCQARVLIVSPGASVNTVQRHRHWILPELGRANQPGTNQLIDELSNFRIS